MPQELNCPNCGVSYLSEELPWLAGPCPNCSTAGNHVATQDDQNWPSSPDSDYSQLHELQKLRVAEGRYRDARNQVASFWILIGIFGLIATVLIANSNWNIAAIIGCISALFFAASGNAFQNSKSGLQGGLCLSFMCLPLPLMTFSITDIVLLLISIAMALRALERRAELDLLKKASAQ